jgi:hypothetical protein
MLGIFDQRIELTEARVGARFELITLCTEIDRHFLHHRSTRSAMSYMAKSFERDPRLESLLANHKKALGIQVESGWRLGTELAFNHGIGL